MPHRAGDGVAGHNRDDFRPTAASPGTRYAMAPTGPFSGRGARSSPTLRQDTANLSPRFLTATRWVRWNGGLNQRAAPYGGHAQRPEAPSHVQALLFHHLPASEDTGRRVILCAQGEWSNPVLDCRAAPGAPLTLGEFIAHCSRTGRDDILERIHAKARRGLPVWMNRQPIEAAKVQRLLDLHDPETD